MAWFDIFIAFSRSQEHKSRGPELGPWGLGGGENDCGEGTQPLPHQSHRKQWGCESVGYQGPLGAHVHGSVGVDGVPTLHVLHLCGVHVLHLQ